MHIVSVFFIFLSTILIVDGWGFPVGREISLYLLGILTLLLLWVALRAKKKFVLPFSLMVTMLLFLLGASITTFTADDFTTAFKHQMYYILAFVWGIVAYNNRLEIGKIFFPFIVLFTAVSLLYTAFLAYALPHAWQMLVPEHGYQFVYRINTVAHAPIGALVLIPLTMTFVYYLHQQKRWQLAVFIALFIILIFSLLRSAYVSFAVVLCGLMLINTRWQSTRLVVFFSGILLVLSLSFVVSTTYSYQIPIVSALYKGLIAREVIPQKSFTSGRFEYAAQAILAIAERPLTGYGSNNFLYASSAYSQNIDLISESSHNIFLDIASENGVITLLFFILIIGMMCVSGIPVMRHGSIEEKSIFAAFVALLLLFQFHFYHRSYSLFLLFVVMGMVVYREEK